MSDHEHRWSNDDGSRYCLVCGEGEEIIRLRAEAARARAVLEEMLDSHRSGTIIARVGKELRDNRRDCSCDQCQRIRAALRGQP